MDGRWLAWTSEQQSVVAIREASEQWLLLRGELDGTTCHEASLPVPLRPASVLLNGSPTAFEYLKGIVSILENNSVQAFFLPCTCPFFKLIHFFCLCARNGCFRTASASAAIALPSRSALDVE
jgi:hypothetical protein